MNRFSSIKRTLKTFFAISLGCASMVTLSACDQISFDGSLVINSPLTILVRVKKSDPFCDLHPGEMGCPEKPSEQIQKKTFTAGSFKSKMSLTTDRELKIQVGGQGSISLQIPKNVNLPANGEVTLTASQVGQPFDVNAKVATTETNSQTMRDRESCSYQEPYTECSVFNGVPNCHTSYRTRWGYQEVEYYVHSTAKHILVDLLPAGSLAPIAHYEGDYHGSQKIYTYKGHCW